MHSLRRANDLAEAYAQVADDLRVQCLLASASSNLSHDNQWRSIRVEIKDSPNAVVRTHKGYCAEGRPGFAGK